MDEGITPSSEPLPEPLDREVVVIGEMPIDELYGKSGNTDPETGMPLTRLDELRAQEEKEHGGRILTHVGEYLSEGAKRTNKMLHAKHGRRAISAGAFVMAVIAVRAGKKHHQKSSEG